VVLPERLSDRTVTTSCRQVSPYRHDGSVIQVMLGSQCHVWLARNPNQDLGGQQRTLVVRAAGPACGSQQLNATGPGDWHPMQPKVIADLGTLTDIGGTHRADVKPQEPWGNAPEIGGVGKKREHILKRSVNLLLATERGVRFR
jgi:hypothetical protein